MATKKVVSLDEKRLDIHFEPVFEQCMKLTARTAAYLDGPGRVHSKLHDRDLTRLYARESMLLTTVLLESAGWLLQWRSYIGGEVGKDHLIRRTKKILCESYAPRVEPTLPKEFVEIIQEVQRLHAVCMRFRTTALMRLSK